MALIHRMNSPRGLSRPSLAVSIAPKERNFDRRLSLSLYDPLYSPYLPSERAFPAGLAVLAYLGPERPELERYLLDKRIGRRGHPNRGTAQHQAYRKFRLCEIRPDQY